MEPASLKNKISNLEAKYKAAFDLNSANNDTRLQRLSRQRHSEEEIQLGTSNSRSRSPWTSSHSVAVVEGVSTTPNRSPWAPAHPSGDASFAAPPLSDEAMKRMSSSWAFGPGGITLVPQTSSASIMSTSLTTCENFQCFDDEFNQLPQRVLPVVSGSVPIARQGDRGYMSQQDLAQAMQSWTTFSTSPPNSSVGRQAISPAHTSRGGADVGNIGASRSNMNGIPQNTKDSFSSDPWNIQWNTLNNSSPSRQGSRSNESQIIENQESLSPYTPSPNSIGSGRTESRTSNQSTPSPCRIDFKLPSSSPSPISLRRVELSRPSMMPNAGTAGWSGGLTISPGSNFDVEKQLKFRTDSSSQSNIESSGAAADSRGMGSDRFASFNKAACGMMGRSDRGNELDCQGGGNEALSEDPHGISAGVKSNEASTSGTPSHGSARPSLTLGGLPLNGQPRRRQALNLSCVPQKVPDRSEMDVKYADIIKQSGFLTLDGQRVPTDIKDLIQLGELGRGTCGHVVRMKHNESGQVMAVKQMHRSGSFEDNKRIMMDLDVVLKCDSCPYIVRFIGTFITTSDVWICMELMATCLEKLSKRLSVPIPEPILGKVTVATVNALHYLKEKHGVIHRDIKPSNILLDERGRIKLCDFGISGRLVDSKAKTRSAGCTAYMSPERIDPPDPMKPDYDIRADVWSLGLSLVEMAIGEFPYKDCKTDFEVLTKVLQSEPPCLPAGCGFSNDFSSFVQQCLTKDYRNRPKYQQLLDHCFVQWYTTAQVDVATWYANAKREIEAKEALKPQNDG